MRTMRWICLLFGIASLFSAEASPQTQDTLPPLPPGPLLNRAPEIAQWLIAVKTGLLAAPQSSKPVQYDQRTLVKKSGQIRYEITEYSDGRRFEKWCTGDYQAAIYPGGQDPVVSMRGATLHGAGGYTDYSKSDFTGFDWISRRKYIGTQSISGVPCFVFHDGPLAPGNQISANGSAPAAVPQTGKTAYIASETLLPVLLQVEAVTTLYQFQQAPAGALTLPPNVQAAFERLQGRIQRAAVPPASP